MNSPLRIAWCVVIGLIPASALWASSTDYGVIVEVLRLPDHGIAPQAATDSRGRLHLIYFTGDPMQGDIFYRHSEDGGKSFSPSLRVNSQPGSALAIGSVRGPQIAVGKNGHVHVAWMGSKRAEPKFEGKATPMLYARLNDAADAFEPQRNLITHRPGLDGGGAVAADDEGNVYVAWHAPGDAKLEAVRQVWLTRSTDEGRTFAPEQPANPTPTGACGCCGLQISSTATGGKVFIAYRSATEMVHRDVHLLASADYGKTFQTALVDPWTIGACTMSTTAIGRSPSSTIAAWETKGQIRFSLLAARERTLSASTVTGQSESQKHPAVAINGKGQFIIAWAEGTGWNKGGAVGWQVFDEQGNAIQAQSGRADGLPAWSNPAVFAHEGGRFGVVY